jgi:citrate lyase alpha subunit
METVMTDRTPHVVGINDEPLVHWLHDPVFKFETEVDALRMLEILGDELKVAREQVRHTTRYLAAAVQAARQVTEDDGKPVSKQAIIGASGLARQTVYNILGES